MALRTKRIIIAALTALFAFAGLGAWAIASPVGAAPDDDYHLASIWCSWGEREGLCADARSEDERVVSERLTLSSKCYAQHETQSAQCDLNDSETLTTDRGNFAGLTSRVTIRPCSTRSSEYFRAPMLRRRPCSCVSSTRCSSWERRPR